MNLAVLYSVSVVFVCEGWLYCRLSGVLALMLEYDISLFCIHENSFIQKFSLATMPENYRYTFTKWPRSFLTI